MLARPKSHAYETTAGEDKCDTVDVRMSGAALPPSLRPWNHETGEAESIKTILGRIYDERGHFRNITEAGLKAEIAAQEDGDDESEGEESDAEGDVKEGKSRPEELLAAKAEMIGHVAYDFCGHCV